MYGFCISTETLHRNLGLKDIKILQLLEVQQGDDGVVINIPIRAYIEVSQRVTVRAEQINARGKYSAKRYKKSKINKRTRCS
jgi:hypothetical protein